MRYVKLGYTEVSPNFYTEVKRISIPKLSVFCEYYGYYEFSLGKTTGSAVKFKNDDGDIIRFHKPHPGNIIKTYVIEQILVKIGGEN